MKTAKILSLGMVVALALFAGACEHSVPVDTTLSTGPVNFASYVAIGNSLTAGFQSSSLFESGQKYSYPALLARQAQQAGASLTFSQPLLRDPGVGGRIRLSQLFPLSLSIDASLDPTSTSIYVDASLPPQAYHNLGIPGAAVFNPFVNANDVLDTTNSYMKSFGGAVPPQYANPFHHIVRRNAGGTFATGNPGSVFEQAKRLNPTVITVWMGNNDILGYATQGGTVPYTDVGVFTSRYSAMIDSLRTTGAKLILGTIPDVAAIPFVTTLKWFIPDPQDPTKPLFGTIIPLKAEKTYGDSLMGPNDFLLLTAVDSLLSGYGMPSGPLFSSFPNAGKRLSSRFVLDSMEVAVARGITSQFNAVIKAYGTDPNIAVVDFHAIFADIVAHGVTVGGQTLTAAFVTGGIFSLDGVHVSGQGNGLIVNEIIRAINNKWGASIPAVDILSLPGVPIPLGKGFDKGIGLDALQGEIFQNAIRWM